MQIICGSVENVELNPHEVCRRLQIPRGFSLDGVDRCAERLRGVMNCRYAYVRVPVDCTEAGICRFDFGEIKSEALSANLRGCSEAFLLAVTVGIGVDRLLHRLNLLSQAEHFITDGLASAAAEALCDEANSIIAQGMTHGSLKPRFSPGYGDVPLSVQVPLLRRLCAEQTLGITLNSACLMTPMKSITAVIGIY